MSTGLLDKIRIYKDSLRGSSHSLFRGLMMCKITGVTFGDRQEVLKQVNKDTPVKLERDRRNKYDFYAVLVKAFVEDEWKEVGFVPANMNKEIAQALDAGVRLGSKVWEKVGGEGEYHHGLTVSIKRQD